MVLKSKRAVGSQWLLSALLWAPGDKWGKQNNVICPKRASIQVCCSVHACWYACLCFLKNQCSEYIKLTKMKHKYYKALRFSSDLLSAQQNNGAWNQKWNHTYVKVASVTVSFRKLCFCKFTGSVPIPSLGSLLFWNVQGASHIMIASRLF